MATTTLVRGVDTSPWTVPENVTTIVVEVWGAGGGGGGNTLSTDGGSGGGGGAYSKRTFTVTPQSTISWSIGQGGTAGAQTAEATAGTGGTTWWASNDANGCVAVGGVGGRAPTAAGVPYVGGAGGAAGSGVGTVKWSGGKGEQGRNSNTGRGGYGGSSAGTGADGWSGPDTWSTETFPTGSLPTGAAAGGNGGTTGAGTAGAVGGGGGGGRGDSAGVGHAGGDGKIIITYFANQTLTASRYDNSNTFYTHTLKLTLAQSARYSNDQTYYTHTLTQEEPSQSLTQTARFDGDATYYAHTLSAGTVTLTQSSQFDNAATFYAHTLSSGTPQTLTQAATYIQPKQDWSPFVRMGLSGVGQRAYGVQRSATFAHAMTATKTLTADRFDNSPTFYTHQANLRLTQGTRFDSSATFYTHVLSQSFWYHAKSLTITVGSVVGGDYSDTFDSDDAKLTLAETLGTPGFDYYFTFRNVPTNATGVKFEGYYEGNPGHNVKLYQWNFNTSGWEALTANTQDLPSATSDQVNSFALKGASGNYASAGEIRIRIAHTSAGSNLHRLYIDRLLLLADLLTQTAAYENTNAFYVHTLTAGPVTLTATRFDNSPTFYTHALATGPVTLTQARFDNSQTYYTHTLSVGAVTLTADRYDNAQLYYTHTVSQGGSPPQSIAQAARFDGSQSFYQHTLTVGAAALTQAARFDSAPGFYQHTLTTGAVALVQSARHDSEPTFYAHTVEALGYTALTQTSRFDNAATFFGHTLTGGAVAAGGRRSKRAPAIRPLVDAVVVLKSKARGAASVGQPTIFTEIAQDDAEARPTPSSGYAGVGFIRAEAECHDSVVLKGCAGHAQFGRPEVDGEVVAFARVDPKVDCTVQVTLRNAGRVRVGRLMAKGIINPTDEELLLMIATAAQRPRMWR